MILCLYCTLSDVAGSADGAPNTNRTCDPSLRRGMLYPLSYRGEVDILSDYAVIHKL